MIKASPLSAWRLRWLSSWRYFRAHPLQLALGILGVTVGVAAVVAVAAARQAVSASFERNLQALEGTASHFIVAADGAIGLSDYADLRAQFPHIAMAPDIREQVRLSIPGQTEDAARRVTVLGLDLISEADFASQENPAAGLLPSDAEIDPADWFGGMPLALVSPELAQVMAGQPLPIRWQDNTYQIPIAGSLSVSVALNDDLVVMDISLASRLFERAGIDRLRLRLNAGQLEQLRQHLPSGLLLRGNNDQSGLGAAFNLNLMAMGLLALLMGVLMVFSTFRLLLLQREPITRLRHALGSSAAAQAGDALCEAILIGLLGTALGLLAGWGLAWWVIHWLQQTLSDLWVSGIQSGIRVSMEMLWLGLLAGLGGALLAVIPLLWRVLKTGYLNHPQAARQLRWALLTGALLLVLAAGLLWRSQSLLLALAALFAATMGYLLWSLPVLGRLAVWLRYGFGWRQWLGVVAARRLQNSLGHTGPALVALLLAVASMIGIGSMIDSFRTSVEDWMDTSLSAAAYVTNTGRALPADMPAEIRRWPEVEAVSWLHTTNIQLNSVSGSDSGAGSGSDYAAELSIVDLPVQGRDSYRMLAGESLWQAGDQALPAVIAGETLAARQDITIGQLLSFQIAGSAHSLSARVVGIFQDYRAGPGRLVILRDALSEPPPAPTAVGLYWSSEQSGDAVRQRFEARTEWPGSAELIDSAQVKAETLRIFDQTFLLTSSLRWIVALVALVGISGALLALQLERRPELQLLQSLGLSAAEQRRLMLYEAGLLGGLAVLLALPLGALLAWLLCEVINQRAFGWHVAVRLLPGHYLLAAAVGLSATLLASLLCLRNTPSAEQAFATPAAWGGRL